MKIDEFIRDINPNKIGAYILIETFILNLLKVHLEKDQKTLLIEKAGSAFDAFAPLGIDSLTGPTQIQIILNNERLTHYRVMSTLVAKSVQSIHYESQKYDTILLIIPSSISDGTKQQLKSIETNPSSAINKKVLLWFEDEINELLDKYKDEALDIKNNLFSLRIKTVVNGSSTNWEEERQGRIEMIKSYFHKGQVSLFLGAGVSSSAGMPDWNTLINSLLSTYITKELGNTEILNQSDLEQIVARLNKIDRGSALMSARYLRKGYEKNIEESRNFTQAISKNLYDLRDKSYKLNSDLIKSIASICLPRRTGARIKAVVTYNFDDLIERQLDSQEIRYLTVFSDSQIPEPEELPIFHVHGFLPENQNSYKFLDKSTLVFSEEGYHQIYAEPYHWSNLIQLSQLRDNHCLLVGFSMTDPNLRRLLEIASSKSDEPRHFAFMKRISDKDFINEQNVQVITNAKRAQSFLNQHHSLNEEIMRELGVHVLWYSNYNEIPQILNEINGYKK